MNKLLLSLLIICLSVSLILPIYARAEDGLFTAVTDDGLNLKLKRYRPSMNAQFNEQGQPVLLFSGILVNMNQFMIRTPDERKFDYRNMTLPNPPADWARGDSYIAEDPMLYYSIAYYLWNQGYDPWFANYRGVGRGDFKSQKGTVYTNLDVWAALDVSALVKLVRTVTGKAPVIGGHSTGGRVAYNYMQGITLDTDKMGGDYIPHVKADPIIAQQRNREVKGLLLLDPGGIPPLPNIIDEYSIWKITGEPIFLNFDGLIEDIVNPLLRHTTLITVTVEVLFGTIDYLHTVYASFPDWLYSNELDLFGFLDVWLPQNTDPYVEDFIARYCVASAYLRALTQYGDNSLHNVMREDWRNGQENKDIVEGPTPARGSDGYYYYDDDSNMARITVPAFAVFSDEGALVDAQEIIRDFFNKKTPNRLDEWHQIPNTAHLDVVSGYSTSAVVYPMISAWLSSLSAPSNSNAGVVETMIAPENSNSTITDKETSGFASLLGVADKADSGAGCGSVANAATRGGGTSPSSCLELLIMCSVLFTAIRLGRGNHVRR
jgi:pimeloyl-ACP methyl ester carboxylesterase